MTSIYLRNLSNLFAQSVRGTPFEAADVPFLHKDKISTSELLRFADARSITTAGFQSEKSHVQNSFTRLAGMHYSDFVANQQKRLIDTINIYWKCFPFLTKDQITILNHGVWNTDKPYISHFDLLETVPCAPNESIDSYEGRINADLMAIYKVIYNVCDAIDAPLPESFLIPINLNEIQSLQDQTIIGSEALTPFGIKESHYKNNVQDLQSFIQGTKIKDIGNMLRVIAAAHTLPPERFTKYRDYLHTPTNGTIQYSDQDNIFRKAMKAYYPEFKIDDAYFGSLSRWSDILDSDRMVHTDLPVIDTLYDAATEALNEGQFITFVMQRLVKSEYKLWGQGLVRATGFAEKTAQNYYFEARHALMQHFKNIESPMANHPFLTTILTPKDSLILDGTPQINPDKIDYSSPYTEDLVAYAETLLERDDYYIFVSQYMYKYSDRKTLSEIATDLDLPEKTVQNKSITIRDKLTTFLQADERTQAYLQHPVFISKTDRIQSMYTSMNDHDMIHMRSPALQHIHKIATEVLDDREFFFVSKALFYDHKDKMDMETIGDLCGLNAESSAIYFQKAKKKLTLALKETNPELASHPVIRKRAMTNNEPHEALHRVINKLPKQNALAKSKRDMASSLFNKEDFALYVSAEPDILDQEYIIPTKDLANALDVSVHKIRDKRKYLRGFMAKAMEIEAVFSQEPVDDVELSTNKPQVLLPK